MEFKIDLGGISFEKANGQTCDVCNQYQAYGSPASMLALDVPEDGNSSYTNTERICTKCMWNTFKTVIKLLNSGKKLI